MRKSSDGVKTQRSSERTGSSGPHGIVPLSFEREEKSSQHGCLWVIDEPSQNGLTLYTHILQLADAVEGDGGSNAKWPEGLCDL